MIFIFSFSLVSPLCLIFDLIILLWGTTSWPTTKPIPFSNKGTSPTVLGTTANQNNTLLRSPQDNSISLTVDANIIKISSIIAKSKKTKSYKAQKSILFRTESPWIKPIEEVLILLTSKALVVEHESMKLWEWNWELRKNLQENIICL